MHIRYLVKKSWLLVLKIAKTRNSPWKKETILLAGIKKISTFAVQSLKKNNIKK